MADNLKVNAKTKILTFKKKHNLLVDALNNLDENSAKIIKVEDITDNIAVDMVKIGDIIEYEFESYIVYYKDSGELDLVCCRGSYLNCLTYLYDAENEVYEYDEGQEYQLLPTPSNNDKGKSVVVSNGGFYILQKIEPGLKLYNHAISFNGTQTSTGENFAFLFNILSTIPDALDSSINKNVELEFPENSFPIGFIENDEDNTWSGFVGSFTIRSSLNNYWVVIRGYNFTNNQSFNYTFSTGTSTGTLSYFEDIVTEFK